MATLDQRAPLLQYNSSPTGQSSSPPHIVQPEVQPEVRGRDERSSFSKSELLKALRHLPERGSKKGARTGTKQAAARGTGFKLPSLSISQKHILVSLVRSFSDELDLIDTSQGASISFERISEEFFYAPERIRRDVAALVRSGWIYVSANAEGDSATHYHLSKGIIFNAELAKLSTASRLLSTVASDKAEMMRGRIEELQGWTLSLLASSRELTKQHRKDQRKKRPPAAETTEIIDLVRVLVERAAAGESTAYQYRDLITMASEILLFPKKKQERDPSEEEIEAALAVAKEFTRSIKSEVEVNPVVKVMEIDEGPLESHSEEDEERVIAELWKEVFVLIRSHKHYTILYQELVKFSARKRSLEETREKIAWVKKEFGLGNA